MAAPSGPVSLLARPKFGAIFQTTYLNHSNPWRPSIPTLSWCSRGSSIGRASWVRAPPSAIPIKTEWCGVL
ncbi:unnamed protein product [Zymoseptoria tritici ST99CH_1E4]|uniref:Uncharacterized protein n=1 Tax=Zymoseptoria tritici ST99CH_1E4 TaxID=1276532 RepID=A0A2H1GU33_ZYMTR|nr:unnamed protein product [Zymoseptoria tritici ST99CH_1E4]